MIGKVLGNRYEILERIGGGGMSVVYKCRCNVLNRFVAIKILRDELTSDPDFVEKFKQESLSAASLTHANIVNIYDTGIEDDTYYIVMEYIKGETLKSYINRKGKLDEKETIRITKQIAEALKHAHSKKIIHRDIKPHNILLTEEGIVKVADFGIARASTSSTINNTSNIIGSVHYFSPEQARGGYVDEKSDIYSLGAVMYEMVTGVVPFDADNHISVAMKHIQEKPILPSKRVNNIQISESLEEIIMKNLEKHQSYRYQNMDEFLKIIKSINVNANKENENILKSSSELVDSSTIIMPKIDIDVEEYPKDENNIINLNLIDENSDKAFKSFFNEEDITSTNDDKNNKKNKRTKNDNNDNTKDEDDNDKKINIPITLLAIFSALIIALIGGIVGFKALFVVPEVSVPDLIGKQEEEGKKTIEDMGLIFQVSDREYNKEFKEGEIIEQSVEEGTKLKKEFPVEVVISKGSRNIEVPNLVGKYAIEAGIILTERGLQEGNVTDEYNANVPLGQIIEQNPVAKATANLDDKVDYIISKGPKISYTIMPKVVGIDIETAKIKIVQNGLTVGQITEENSDTDEIGLVMNQSMPAGAEIEVKTPIWLTVSIGPKEVVDKENTNPDVENNTDNNGNGDTNDTSTEVKSYPLTITLPSDKETVLVVVQRITEEGREIIYSKQINTSEKSITLNIEGTGIQRFEIYMDNELYDKAIDITFE